MAAAFKLVAALVLCMLVVEPMATSAITCGQVTTAMAPCLTYLKSGGAPTAKCCGGVKGLNAAAKSTPDRQTACKCLQSAAKSAGITGPWAESLPGKCNVNIPYKISMSTNCNNVK